jgi:glycosyltransferase involved in cell wall biosynthesis
MNSRFGRIPAIDHDGFEMFESNDAADLARAIRRMHSDPARRAELVRNATARNEAYRWPRQRAQYLEIVQRNVGPRALASESAPAAGGGDE